MFTKNISGMQSECQTVLIQIRPGILFEPDMDPNCWEMLPAGSTSRLRVQTFIKIKHFYLLVI